MIREDLALDTSDKDTRYMSSGTMTIGGRMDPGFEAAATRGFVQSAQEDDRAGNMTRDEYMRMFRTARDDAARYFDTAIRPQWARATKAFHNQHFDGSKYLSQAWRNRSKLFRPKTRVAVRKQMATLVKALLGMNDVIALTPQDEGDELQRASAAMKQEILKYRLDRKSRRNSVPWLQICVGSRQDSLLYGIAVSKQTWSYVEEVDATGKRHLLQDRPEVILYAPENCLFSPLCDWRYPAQTSEYLQLKQEMSLSDVLILLQSGERGPVKFDKDITKQFLMSTAAGTSTRSTTSHDTQSTRSARHGGNDPLAAPNKGDPKFWVTECFYRIDGKDMVFWVLDDRRLISEPIPVREAYPHMHGERPVVIGYGSLEAHRAVPMSPVESWQPLQAEINDQVNLRLDHMKQVVTPLAKVKRGQNIDLKAVQTRGGNNGVVLVQNAEDLDWAQIPDLPQSAYVENQYLNADFDDAAGTFNSGSVMTNRSMNETVGGMKLLAGDSNQIGDFDLTIFVETYLEQVVWQIVKSIEFYESDTTILAIAGKKAKLVEKFGITDITDEFLMAETHVSIKIGIGVSNMPMERLQKFGMAGKMFGEFASPFIEQGKNKMPSLKLREVANAIFGDAGIPDASDRFFEGIDDEPAPENPQGQMPPEMIKMQAEIEMMKAELGFKKEAHQQDMAFEREKHQMEMQQDEQQAALDNQLAQQNQQFKLQENAVNSHMRMQQAQQQIQTGAVVAQQKLQHGEMATQQKLRQGDQQFQQKQQQQALQVMPPAQGGGAPMAQGGGADITQLATAIMQLAQQMAEQNKMMMQLVAANAGGQLPPSAGMPQ